MSVTILAKVGYKSQNRPDDVKKIHDLLKRIPISSGGAPLEFDPARLYSQQTDQLIYNFQLKHFPKQQCDASVWPGGATLAKLNALAGTVSPAPVPLPAPERGEPRRVRVTVTSRIVGIGRNKGYCNPPIGLYQVPLYEVVLNPVDGSPGGETYSYKAYRFSPNLMEPGTSVDKPLLAGLRAPREVPLRWNGAYLNNSGGWIITGNFMIHGGAWSENVAIHGNGCVMITGHRKDRSGVDEHDWYHFRSTLKRLAYGDDMNPRNDEDRLVRKGAVICKVESASLPTCKLLSREL